MREETFARQKRLGVIPHDAELTARPDGIPAWRDIAEDMKPVLARQMELYAAFLEHTDWCIGQVLDAIDELGALDDTLVYVITGDNGASGEGTLNGTWNESLTMTGMVDVETPEFLRERLDDLRHARVVRAVLAGLGPRDGHAVPVDEARGLALGRHAQRPDRPLAGRASRHAARSATSSTTSSMSRPPSLRSPRLPRAATGPRRRPAADRGREHGYSFDAADAPERHETQYFEVLGNRGIYHKGWTAVTAHNPPVPTTAAVLRRRRLGAVRHEHRLDPGARPREGAAGQAPRVAADVPHRGGKVQRPAAR